MPRGSLVGFLVWLILGGVIGSLGTLSMRSGAARGAVVSAAAEVLRGAAPGTAARAPPGRRARPGLRQPDHAPRVPARCHSPGRSRECPEGWPASVAVSPTAPLHRSGRRIASSRRSAARAAHRVPRGRWGTTARHGGGLQASQASGPPVRIPGGRGSPDS